MQTRFSKNGSDNMNLNRMVSVWFGVSESFQTLEEYVDIKYTEDGDAIDSSLVRTLNLAIMMKITLKFVFTKTPKII